MHGHAKCPGCNKDLSNLPSDIRKCPHCGTKLETDLWDELLDEEKERETLGIMRDARVLAKQHMRKLLRLASIVSLNLIVFFGAWLLYSVSLHHWLAAVLAIGLVAIMLLFDLFMIFEQK